MSDVNVFKHIPLLTASSLPDDVGGTEKIALVLLDARNPSYTLNNPLRPVDAWPWLASLRFKNFNTIVIFASPETVSKIDVACTEVLGLHRVNHVVCVYDSNHTSVRTFNDAHYHLLYYTTESEQYTFNVDDVLIPSARQTRYRDIRPRKGKRPSTVWGVTGARVAGVLDVFGDAWVVESITAHDRERVPGLCRQIPVSIYMRIIKVATNINELVVDLWASPGSSAIAAGMTGRNFFGFCHDQHTLATTQARVTAAQQELSAKELEQHALFISTK